VIRQRIATGALVFESGCFSLLSRGERIKDMTSSPTKSIQVSSLDEYLNRALRRVEAALGAYLPDVDADPRAACPARLALAMHYSVFGRGKRLRPILCLLATEACGGDTEAALPACCALEMVHTYSLIHDDLPAMDNDDLRRGRLTCHRAFDEATAILAGDALLTLAFEVVAHDVRPVAAALQIVAILAEAAGPSGMVAGQMADLQADGRTELQIQGQHGPPMVASTMTLALLESIHNRKTGALLRAPLRIGAVIAGASQPCIEALDRYGRAVGLAFQIVDDLLDVEGDQTKLGKRVRKDFQLGKWTYPRFLGVEGSRSRARQLADEAVAELKPLGPRSDRLRDLALALVERDH
jgi:geranylgeranyl diphosphate synthase type II